MTLSSTPINRDANSPYFYFLVNWISDMIISTSCTFKITSFSLQKDENSTENSLNCREFVDPPFWNLVSLGHEIVTPGIILFSNPVKNIEETETHFKFGNWLGELSGEWVSGIDYFRSANPPCWALIRAQSGLIFTCGKLIFDITQKVQEVCLTLWPSSSMWWNSRYNVYIDARAGVLTWRTTTTK